MENEKFSDYIRQYGEKRKVVSMDPSDGGEESGGQLLVTKEGMLDWIRQV